MGVRIDHEEMWNNEPAIVVHFRIWDVRRISKAGSAKLAIGPISATSYRWPDTDRLVAFRGVSAYIADSEGAAIVGLGDQHEIRIR